MRIFRQHGHAAPVAFKNDRTAKAGSLESEVLSVHRQLSILRNDYLELSLQAGKLAAERDFARRACEKTEAYIAFTRSGEYRSAENTVCDSRQPTGHRSPGHPVHPAPGQTNRWGALDELRQYLVPRSRLLAEELAGLRSELSRLDDDYLALAEYVNALAEERDAAIEQLENARHTAEACLPVFGPPAPVSEETGQPQVDDSTRRLTELDATLDRTRKEKADINIMLYESEDRVTDLEQQLAASHALNSRVSLTTREMADALDRERDDHTHAIDGYEEQITRLQRQIAGIETESAIAHRQIESLNTTLADAKARHETSLWQLQRLDSELGEYQARLTERAQRVSELEATEARLRSQLESAGERLTESERAQAAAREASRRLGEKLEKALDDARSSQEGKQAEIDALRQQAGNTAAELENTRRRLEDQEALLVKLSSEKTALEQRLQAVEQARLNVSKRNQFLAGELHSVRNEYAEARRTERRHIEALQNRFAEVAGQLAAANRKAENAVFAASQAAHAGKSEAVHAKPRRWTSVAAGFVFLLGILASLAKFWDFDDKLVHQAGVSREVATVSEKPVAVEASSPEPPQTAAIASLETDRVALAETADPTQREHTVKHKGGRLQLPFRQKKPRSEIARLESRRAMTTGARPSGPTVYAWLMEGGDAVDIWYENCVRSPADTEGCEYLKDNLFKEGVVQLDSGVQYSVIKNGSGASPGPDDTVSVNFRGMLLDGTEFDSSQRHGGPSSFRVREAIPGLQEALQYMEEGARWEVYIPSELAFRKPAQFGGQVVIFDVELLSVGEEAPEADIDADAEKPVEISDAGQQPRQDESPAGGEQPAPIPQSSGVQLWQQIEARTRRFLEENARKEGVVSLPSGLQYKILGHSKGGGRRPRETDEVVIHYRGSFADGREIDSSREDGDPVTFNMRELMPGWQEALLQMQVGDRWELYIPPDLAQSSEIGKLGIRGRQAQIYELELLEVK